jgi:cytoskeleton protein RodZ
MEPEPTAEAEGGAAVDLTAAEAAPAAEPEADSISGMPALAASTPRVILQADLESWVQVIAPDGSTVVSRVLRTGEMFSIPDLPGLTMVTGNAGGLAVYVDGRRLPPLGPVGVVRRGVPLDPEKISQYAAAQ